MDFPSLNNKYKQIYYTYKYISSSVFPEPFKYNIISLNRKHISTYVSQVIFNNLCKL